MLPQLSYVVAQAGVDARPLPPPPSMLSRLAKPLYIQGELTHRDRYVQNNNNPQSVHHSGPDALTALAHHNTPLSGISSTSLPYAYPSSLPYHTPTITTTEYGPGHIASQQKSSPSMIISPDPPSYPPPSPPTPAMHHHPVKNSWPTITNGSVTDHRKAPKNNTRLGRLSRGLTVPDQTTTTTTATTTTTWYGSNDTDGHTYPLSSEHPGRHEATAVSGTTSIQRYTSLHRVEHLQEWNQLLTWMEHQFCEQKEDAYHEKLAFLQQELQSLQNNAHETYLELVADLELKRESMIADAAWFFKYQQEWVDHLYQEDIIVIEEEYDVERRHLHDAIIAVIEERKKQVKEDKEPGLLNIKDLFSEGYFRVTNKRTLRKRIATEFGRQDSRKRPARHTASHHLESVLEREDELDEDLMLMKKQPVTLAPLG